MKRAWILLTILLATAAAVVALVAQPEWLEGTQAEQLFAALKGRGETSSDARAKNAESRPEAELVEWINDGWCATHHVPEESCPQCQGKTWVVARPCLAKLRIIRLADRSIASRVGLATAKVLRQRHAETLYGNAVIAYNSNQFAEVRPRVAGILTQVLVDEGHLLKKGDILAVIDSSEVGAAKAAYLSVLPVLDLARTTLDRTKSLAAASALPMKDQLEAQASYNTARAAMQSSRQNLKNLGFSEADLEQVAQTQDTESRLNVVAPIDGVIVERHAVAGEALEPMHQLFAMADLSLMWCWVDVYENEIAQVKPKQPVRFSPSGMDIEEAYDGEVDWIDTAVNPETRTIRVRAVIPNKQEKLRSNQFGRAEIQVGEEHDVLICPNEAVQDLAGDGLVFLVQEDGSYRPQHIHFQKGLRGDSGLEVLWGLKEGQEVVTTGSFLLKSELLKDELGGD